MSHYRFHVTNIANHYSRSSVNGFLIGWMFWKAEIAPYSYVFFLKDQNIR